MILVACFVTRRARADKRLKDEYMHECASTVGSATTEQDPRIALVLCQRAKLTAPKRPHAAKIRNLVQSLEANYRPPLLVFHFFFPAS